MVPSQTLERRTANLRRANAIRTARCALKRDLRAGRTSAAEILTDTPDYALSMKVYDLLVAQRAIGPVKARRTLVACQISPVKTIAGLSVRQRTVLAEALA